MKKHILFQMITVTLLALVLGVMPGSAQQPQVAAGSAFTYQGQLKDAGGNPINATCDFNFILYSDAGGTHQVGTLQSTTTAVTNGYFTASPDFGAAVFNGTALWLRVGVRCPTTVGSYTFLNPLQPITAAPYASFAASVPWSGVTGAPAANAHNHWGQAWTGTGTGLTLNGDIGLQGNGVTEGVYGTSSSTTYGYGLYGESIAAAGNTYGVYGHSRSPNGAGVYGYSSSTAGSAYGIGGTTLSTDGYGVFGKAEPTTGAATGVYGESFADQGSGVKGVGYSTSGAAYGVQGVTYSPAGTGVYGYASPLAGYTVGVRGAADSVNGAGVFGLGNNTTGQSIGVEGYSNSTSGFAVFALEQQTSGGNYALYAADSSPTGYAVYAQNNAATGKAYAVYGNTSSTSGVAVAGMSAATVGFTFGVVGQSASTNHGVGVYGETLATSGVSVGVKGETLSNDTNAAGVYGQYSGSGSGKGVYGLTGSTPGYGVYGEAAASNANYGVFSYGNTGATGTKSAVVKTDAYGWVSLYSMESPRVLFEDVNTALLVDGKAVVTIDPVFAQTVDLSQPYQVFLTPGGDCSLYVSQKTSASFSVSTMDGKTCSIAFDYRLIAVRKGYAGVRLMAAEDPNTYLSAKDLPANPPDQDMGGLP